MMEINRANNKFRLLYLAGFFIILALPLFNLPPWLYPPDWGKTIIFRSVLAIMLFFCLWEFLCKKTPIRKPLASNGASKIIWALSALFVVYLLASIFSVDPYFSFWGSPYRGGGFVTFAFYFVFALLTFFIFKKGGDWKKVWIFSIFIGILVSFIALSQFYGLFNKIFISAVGGMGSTIGNPIFLGIYLLLLFFPTLAFAIKEPFDTAQGKFKKIFYIFSLLLFLYVIFIAGSRAAYLGIVIGILCFLFFYPVRNQPKKSDSNLQMNQISNGVYPKKLAVLKILIALFLIFIAFMIFYMNTQSHFPKILQNNKIFEILSTRLSIEAVLHEGRFPAWQIALEEIEDRPILGWGPENLAVGFDKNYDPNITSSPWWDKAHNIFLDIGAQAGVLGILAYLSLFGVLFWSLHKTKHKSAHETTQIEAHGIQATLAGYLVANFFSFDSFPTYLLFFFIIGYILHLTTENNISENPLSSAKIKEKGYKPIKGRGIIMGVPLIILVLFLWQYNIVPFSINTKINIANTWVDMNKCNSALALMEKLATQHSFIDSYLRMKYVDDLKTCSAISPDKNLEYAQRGTELLEEAVKIQPLYTRFWIYLGSFTTVVANNKQDSQTKQNLINQSYSYFDKAEALAPLHQGTFIERAKIDMVAGDYQKMAQDAQKCIDIKPDLGECYWEKSLAELYMNDQQNAEKDKRSAESHGFITDSKNACYQLIDVYIKTEQYNKLVDIYKDLIHRYPNIAQYHSSLAFVYFKLGRYKDAREEALYFLKLMPEAKDEVDAFLKTLPY